jgi:hypothetical protein
MSTKVVRVPEEVRGEVQAAARLMGCEAPALLARAWECFRESPDFMHEFALAQKAFSSGDLQGIAARLVDQGSARARERAERVRSLRQPNS